MFNPALTLETELVVRPELRRRRHQSGGAVERQRWVVAWEDEREGGEPAIYATVATARRQLRQHAPARLRRERQLADHRLGRLMTSLIGFYGFPGRRVFLARVEATGVLSPARSSSTTCSFPAVTYNSAADEYAVVYQNDDSSEILFARFKCAN